ncbi:quinone oxidoreductase [Sphingosinicellaceae bacterium]|nr:quinone oxidoreductase [Sphingosinicellaceae bacterium]
MERAAVVRTHGGPEVIEWDSVELAPPGVGEVRMRNTAVGLNYIDTYYRRGIYPITLPTGLGTEAAGVVEAVGPGVEGLATGDRVATFGLARGAYSTARNVAANSLFKLPDDIDDETAAATMLKGCTTEYLAERCGRVEAGWMVLVHAAAGGVGLLLTQWLTAMGVHVIGTVGDAEKAKLASAAGAQHIIEYRHEDVAARVREITGGKGVPVVFDGVGMAMWEASLASTARRGLIVSYGNSDAPVTGVGLGVLAAKGSLFVTRPTLFDYYVDPAERVAGAERLWSMLRSGKVKVTIGQRYKLEDVAQAHADLEGRKTTGSTILTI